MEIKFTALHHIDHLEKKIEKIDIGNQKKMLETYVERLLEEITDSPRKKSFLFQRNSTEVRSAIDKLVNEDYELGSQIIAERLLPIEQKAQKKIKHLGVEIQKGSLFQTIAITQDGKFIIISKADHNEFLDEKDFLIHKGLPWKKKVFKAFMAKIEPDNSLSSIFIYDTNNVMSKYWWNEYFELNEKHTDKHNTETALDMLDVKIFNGIKKNYPADHTILRNSTIGYFRSKEEFEIQEFVSSVFESYEPVDENFPLNRIKRGIFALPEKWNFDNRFSISKEDIKKRAFNRIMLDENIELVLKDYVDLEQKIVAITDEEGEKYIKIKTKTGYDRFKKD